VAGRFAEELAVELDEWKMRLGQASISREACNKRSFFRTRASAVGFLTDELAVREGMPMNLAIEQDEWEVRKEAPSLGSICGLKQNCIMLEPTFP
jgi:hypothetical protein